MIAPDRPNRITKYLPVCGNQGNHGIEIFARNPVFLLLDYKGFVASPAAQDELIAVTEYLIERPCEKGNVAGKVFCAIVSIFRCAPANEFGENLLLVSGGLTAFGFEALEEFNRLYVLLSLLDPRPLIGQVVWSESVV